MATLPFKSTVAARTLAEINSIHTWCLETWPHTHGATWYRGLVTQGHPVYGAHGIGWKNLCTWSFQREADQRLFNLVWYELLVPPETPAVHTILE